MAGAEPATGSIQIEPGEFVGAIDLHRNKCDCAEPGWVVVEDEGARTRAQVGIPGLEHKFRPGLSGIGSACHRAGSQREPREIQGPSGPREMRRNSSTRKIRSGPRTMGGRAGQTSDRSTTRVELIR